MNSPIEGVPYVGAGSLRFDMSPEAAAAPGKPQHVTHTWKSTLVPGVSMPVQRTLQDRRVVLFAKGCFDDLLPKFKPYTIVSAV